MMFPFAVLLMLLFVACKKDNNQKIVGAWQTDRQETYTEDGSYHHEAEDKRVWEFDADGKGRSVHPLGSVSFTWYLSDDLQKLTIVYLTGFASSLDIEFPEKNKLYTKERSFQPDNVVYITKLEMSRKK